jgi:hypothetical protein
LLSDSTWGIRLYSALIGSATIALLTWWLARRVGRRFAFLSALALTLSPMAIFYSQDANHYAPVILSGLLSVIAIDTLMERGKRGLAGLFAIAAVQLLFMLYHPLTLFTLGATVSAFVLWLFVHAESIGSQRLTVGRKRLYLALALCVCAAATFGILLSHYALNWRNPPMHGRRFGLNWNFLSAIAGSFYGGIYRYAAIDTVLGASGCVFTIIGLVQMARDRSTRWIAAGAVLTIAAVVLPFCVISTRQYFSPRYLAAMLVPLLLGAVYPMASGNAGRVLRIIALVWFALFAARSVTWEVHRLRGDFQPSTETMRWIAEHTPDDAVIHTRHRYSSLDVAFLWERFDMGAREHVPLSFHTFSGAVAMQQLAEMLHGDNRPHYYLSFLEDEEFVAEGFGQWLLDHGGVVQELKSWSPDAFVPIDWSITIRKLRAAEENPLALPRNGAAASFTYPEDRAAFPAGFGESRRMHLVTGSSAVYNLALEESAPGLRFTFDVPGGAQTPARMVFLLDGEQVWLAPVTVQKGAFTVALPARLEAGAHRVEVLLPAATDQSLAKQQADLLLVDVLREGAAADAMARPLQRVAEVECAADFGAEELRDMPARALQQTAVSLPAEVRDDAELFVMLQRQYPHGTGDRKIHTFVHSDGGPTVYATARHSWSFAAGHAAAVIASAQWNDPLVWKVELVEGPDFRPRPHRLELGDVDVWALGKDGGDE